jgi:NAD kinase
MFSKIFVAWKKNYGEKIALSVCSILRSFDLDYTFDSPKNCDLAILVGGDGTVLKHQTSISCPIFGINPGKSVGFYMGANFKDFEKKLRKILAGKEGKDYFIFKFSRLKAEINKIPLPFHALNEILVSPIYTRRILNAELKIKGKISKERNSGIIIYTPSGSYAYANSAGAKILKDENKFGIVAIAPYEGTLKKGEIILDKGKIAIKCLNEEGEVCVDGQEEQVCKIKKDDIVSVYKSDEPAKIIMFHKKG